MSALDSTQKPTAAPPSDPGDESRHVVHIKPRHGLNLSALRELWEFRELLYFLGLRDIKIRYKQTIFGAGWAVIQPLALMGVFALVMGRFLHVPSDGYPYPIFAYTALLPWTLFSQCLAQSSNSLLTNAALVSKVYFPRIALPIAASMPFALDFSVGALLLLVLMGLYSVHVSATVVLILPLALVAILTAIGTGLWLSALNARFRDVQAVIPLVVQLWLFASPIAYPSSLVPAKWLPVYALNPMVTVIDGFRWALLGSRAPTAAMAAASAGTLLVLFLGGLLYFQRTERTFADVI